MVSLKLVIRTLVAIGCILYISCSSTPHVLGQCGLRYIHWDFVQSAGSSQDLDYPDTPCLRLRTTSAQDGDKFGPAEYYFDAFKGIATNVQCTGGTQGRVANGFTRTLGTVSAEWKDCLDNT
jgi:hypothetical protein